MFQVVQNTAMGFKTPLGATWEARASIQLDKGFSDFLEASRYPRFFSHHDMSYHVTSHSFIAYQTIEHDIRSYHILYTYMCIYIYMCLNM